MNSQGIVFDPDQSPINFINVDNLFKNESTKLSYEDFCAVTEDFATMHINEHIIDQVESFGYNWKDTKEAIRKGELNHATTAYNLLKFE